MLLVRFLFYGLAEFSGFGFTSDVFIHMEVESVRVAWEQYRLMILALLGVLVVAAGIVILLARRMARPSRRVGLAILVPAAVVALTCHKAMPEWMLAESAYEWYQPKRLDMPEAEQQRWRNSGLVNVDLKKKSDITVEPPEHPRNLILLYIESGGLRVIDPPKYPRLMPNLARLVRERSLVPSIHASSYITIEGIVNSQCGTLFPFERDSESLTGLDGAAEEMPCLGDVLHAAGYRQSYLGGAGLSFAGKGNFLRAHGYDKQMGMREWVEQGLNQRPGTWGLSDADLFEQSFVELAALRRSGQPFNLTLLTIGTHLPGFFYEECSPYGAGNERFLNALHCTDQLIRRWLDRLEAEGYLKDSLVVITGDHNVFPNPEMQRLFGKDAIADRRLPFIVLGDGSNASSDLDGAGVDLAPTVLDLLRIRHDAQFALGRSLLKREPNRNYFVSRYIDIFNNEPVDPAHGPCSENVAPSPPLNICDKKSLLTLLRIQNAAFSRPSAKLRCERAERTRILIPDSIEQPMRILVDGVDQALRFSWMERTLHESMPGLYLIAFDQEGNLLQRKFYPEEEKSAYSKRPIDPDGTKGILAVWRSTNPFVRPPAWMHASSRAKTATATLLDTRGTVARPLNQHASDAGSEFVLDRNSCDLIISTR
ncbi:LTA synthase family protein [Dokdonella immobilis]|nr:LTA synthase family protein [Dokdonella immobilis]